MPTREVAVVLLQVLVDVVLAQAAMAQVLHAVRSEASSMVRDAPQRIAVLTQVVVLAPQRLIRPIAIARTIVRLLQIPTRTPIVLTTAPTTQIEVIVSPLHLRAAAEVDSGVVALAVEARAVAAVLVAAV